MSLPEGSRAGEDVDPAAAPAEVAFGDSTRQLRRERGWTLGQLSDRTGVSVSALSKIENGQVSASFDTRVKIAHAFGQSFGQMQAPSLPPQFPVGRRTFTRAGTGQTFRTKAYDYEVHSGELTLKGMIPLAMRIRARTVMPRSDWSNHDGEEFIYVTRGAIELHTEFYAPLRMTVGDSAYIDSRMCHAFVTVSEEDAEILSICMTEHLPLAENAPDG